MARLQVFGNEVGINTQVVEKQVKKNRFLEEMSGASKGISRAIDLETGRRETENSEAIAKINHERRIFNETMQEKAAIEAAERARQAQAKRDAKEAKAEARLAAKDAKDAEKERLAGLDERLKNRNEGLKISKDLATKASARLLAMGENPIPSAAIAMGQIDAGDPTGEASLNVFAEDARVTTNQIIREKLSSDITSAEKFKTLTKENYIKTYKSVIDKDYGIDYDKYENVFDQKLFDNMLDDHNELGIANDNEFKKQSNAVIETSKAADEQVMIKESTLNFQKDSKGGMANLLNSAIEMHGGNVTLVSNTYESAIKDIIATEKLSSYNGLVSNDTLDKLADIVGSHKSYLSEDALSDITSSITRHSISNKKMGQDQTNQIVINDSKQSNSKNLNQLDDNTSKILGISLDELNNEDGDFNRIYAESIAEGDPVKMKAVTQHTRKRESILNTEKDKLIKMEGMWKAFIGGQTSVDASQADLNEFANEIIINNNNPNSTINEKTIAAYSSKLLNSSIVSPAIKNHYSISDSNYEDWIAGVKLNVEMQRDIVKSGAQLSFYDNKFPESADKIREIAFLHSNNSLLNPFNNDTTINEERARGLYDLITNPDAKEHFKKVEFDANKSFDSMMSDLDTEVGDGDLIEIDHTTGTFLGVDIDVSPFDTEATHWKNFSNASNVEQYLREKHFKRNRVAEGSRASNKAATVGDLQAMVPVKYSNHYYRDSKGFSNEDFTKAINMKWFASKNHLKDPEGVKGNKLSLSDPTDSFSTNGRFNNNVRVVAIEDRLNPEKLVLSIMTINEDGDSKFHPYLLEDKFGNKTDYVVTDVDLLASLAVHNKIEDTKPKVTGQMKRGNSGDVILTDELSDNIGSRPTRLSGQMSRRNVEK